MERRTHRSAEIVKGNIFKIDAAIVRLLEKRLAQCDEAAWASDGTPCVRQSELSSLVIEENKEQVRRIMEQIDKICREKNTGES
ncbi:MAG: hypothetical protein AB9835_08840 [Eubacteriales bacterium]